MAAVELATAYVSLSVSARGVGAQINKELGVPLAQAAQTASANATKSLKITSDQLTKYGRQALAASAVMGTAIIGSAVSFEKLGLKIGRTTIATGLATEAASRWVEVAEDLGIASTSLDTALGRMNRAALATPALFDSIGASVIRTNTGAVDVQETFLSVIDSLNSISDPAQRQVAAMGILGRGWQDMAELVAAGSDTLRTSLAAVGDEKIRTDEQVAQARAFRDTIETLKDSVEKLALGLGESLVPKLAAVAQVATTAISAFNSLDGATGGIAGNLLLFGTAALGVVGAAMMVTSKVRAMKLAMVAADGSLTGLGRAAKGFGIAMGIATVAVIGLSLAQASDAKNAKNHAKALDDMTAATKKAASGVADQLLITTMFKNTNFWGTMQDATDAFKGITKESLAASVAMRDAAMADPVLAAKFAGMGLTIEDMNKIIGDEVIAQKNMATATDKATGMIDDQTDSAGALAAKTALGTAATEAATKAQQDFTDKLQGTIDALLVEAGLQQDKVDAAFAAADATYAMSDAVDAFATFQAELNQKILDAKGDQRIINGLYREGALLAYRVAAGAKEMAIQTAAANGKTLTQTELLDIQNTAMLYQAQSASPALRAEIVKYMGLVNQLPESVITDITAHLNAGEFDAAYNDLIANSQARQATILVDADTSAAQTAVTALENELKNPVVLKVTADVAAFEVKLAAALKTAANKIVGLLGLGSSKATVTVAPTGEGLATGGFSSASNTLVGEQGPELVSLPTGSFVHNASDTRMLMTNNSLNSNGGTMSKGLSIGTVIVNNDVDADSFFRYANFATAAQ